MNVVQMPKRRGKAPGRRRTIAFRCTEALRHRLDALASAEGRPVSEVIENRLERSFLPDDLADQIAEAVAAKLKGEEQ